MSNVLTGEQVDEALAALTHWRREGDAIVSDRHAPTFAAGIEWVARVAAAADEADHHPDIDIRYTTLTFRLSTHSAGGITQRDLDLAARIDELAG